MTGSDVTRLLDAAGGGDREAYARLYDRVYGELREMAESTMRRERPGHTLQPTALVNEAYLRLGSAAAGWENRRHFFGAAALAMRRILVDHARARLAERRGAGVQRVTLTDLEVSAPEAGLDVLAVNEALDQLAAEEPRLAEVVNLRFFAGMSIEDTARALDLSPATVKRDWTFARAWLGQHIETEL
ncbi:MAG: sigma-70 family RNA polymerase sigma factor [Pseudomonadota bacterium]